MDIEAESLDEDIEDGSIDEDQEEVQPNQNKTTQQQFTMPTNQGTLSTQQNYTTSANMGTGRIGMDSHSGNLRDNNSASFQQSGYHSGWIEKVCTCLSNVLFKFSIQWHSKAKDAREQMIRRSFSIFVIIGGIISLSYGQGFMNRATLDNYDIQHNQILNYVTSWNEKYNDQAKQLNIMIGNLGHTKHQVNDEISLQKRFNDKMKDDYPYAKQLLDKHYYQPLSFVEFKFGKIIRKSKTERKVFAPDGFQYNITTDISYEIVKQGQTRQGVNSLVFHNVTGIPMIQKHYEALKNPKDCKYTYHGSYNHTSKKCLYYLQTRKICLVIDQNTTNFQPVKDYQNYKCNYLNHKSGYIMTSYFRWFHEDEEPTLQDLTAERLTMELLMSEEPNVKTVSNLDVFHFDLKPSNYRLESIFCFMGVIISVFLTLFLCSYKESDYVSIDLEQKVELQALENKDQQFKKIRDKKRDLEAKKRRARKVEIDQIQARDMMRKMMLQSNSHFNTTNQNQMNRGTQPRSSEQFDINDQSYHRDMYSDNSSAIGGNNVNSQLGFLTNQSMYSIGTNPDLDFSNLEKYDEDFTSQQYQLAKDTSWSFAQESFDKSQESSFTGQQYNYDKGDNEQGIQIPDVSMDQYLEEKAQQKYTNQSVAPTGQQEKVISNEMKTSLAELRAKRSKQLTNPVFGAATDLQTASAKDDKINQVFEKYAGRLPDSGAKFIQLSRDSNLEQSPEPRQNYSEAETPGKQE